MKKFELMQAARDYLSAVSAGTDPVSKSALPADSVGMTRTVRDAAGFAADRINAALANRSGKNKLPGGVNALYDNMTVLEDLSAGRVPGTDEIVSRDDPMGSARMRRCFASAADMLDEMFDKARGRSKASFRMPAGERANIGISDEPVLVTGLTKNINACNPDPERVNGVQAQLINDWLEREGYLAGRSAPGAVRLPTEAGVDLGLCFEKRPNRDGETYDAVLFDANAQKYVVSHLDSVAALAREQSEAREQSRQDSEKAARREAAIKKNRSRAKEAERQLGTGGEPAPEAEAGKEPDPWA